MQYGAARFEQTKLGDSNAVLQYFSPSFLVMENANDPRHRVTGECRGQGLVAPEGQTWIGGCTWKNAAGEVGSVFWYSKPGDMGTEKRSDVSHGTFKFVSGTGRMAALKGKTGNGAGSKAGALTSVMTDRIHSTWTFGAPQPMLQFLGSPLRCIQYLGAGAWIDSSSLERCVQHNVVHQLGMTRKQLSRLSPSW